MCEDENKAGERVYESREGRGRPMSVFIYGGAK